MLRLFSRPVRPAAAARRRKLTVNRLEGRDCPAAPVIDMTVTSLGGNAVEIRGTVLDESPQECLVNLGGVTTPISLVDADGTFEITTTVPGGDVVTAFAVDSGGQSSQVALRAVSNVAPSIVDFDVVNEGGCITVSGRVVDENPDLCLVTLTSSVAVFNNVTLTPAQGGYFSYSATPSGQNKTGSLRVVATDPLGLTSTPIDTWIS